MARFKQPVYASRLINSPRYQALQLAYRESTCRKITSAGDWDDSLALIDRMIRQWRAVWRSKGGCD